MTKVHDKFTVSVCGSVIYLIPALLLWIVFVVAAGIAFGLFWALLAFHAPKWLRWLSYIAASVLLHFIAAKYPHVSSQLRQSIRHSPNGLVVFRLLQTGALVATGIVLWFFWRFV